MSPRAPHPLGCGRNGCSSDPAATSAPLFAETARGCETRRSAWPARSRWPSSRRSCSATTRANARIITDPDLVDELARFLREARRRGCGRDREDRTSTINSTRTVPSQGGRLPRLRSDALPLVDASAEQVAHDYSRGLAQTTIARTWRDADFRISFAKMRSHPIELAYLSVANVRVDRRALRSSSSSASGRRSGRPR